MLNSIHSILDFEPSRELRNELPEQLMACKYIKESDKVLELGGSIGRNSCVINTILSEKTAHVVVEPSDSELRSLYRNREANNLKFEIESSVISPKPLYSLGWRTFERPVQGAKRVPGLTYQEFKKKYPIDFTTLVVDNEGNFVPMIKAFPEMLQDFSLVIIEHDFLSETDYDYFLASMKEAGFEMDSAYMKTDPHGPGRYWEDGLASDDIFVSAWLKS